MTLQEARPDQQPGIREGTRTQLESEVITLIVDSVNLHHVPRATISAETSLGTGGLELDSVDLLEIVVAIEKRFGLKVKDAETGMKYFKTIGTITDFVQLNASQQTH